MRAITRDSRAAAVITASVIGMQPVRARDVRTADTLAMLGTPAIDVWVSTASASGDPHLVPLSLGWTKERVVLAVDGASITARNLTAAGVARLAVGPTRDVVMIDAVLQETSPVSDGGEWGAAYVRQADWDPRGEAGYVFLVLRPTRVQAWREANEIAGRTLMRDGTWLV